MKSRTLSLQFKEEPKEEKEKEHICYKIRFVEEPKEKKPIKYFLKMPEPEKEEKEIPTQEKTSSV